MIDFNIKKCKKALKSIRKSDEKDYEIGVKKEAKMKSKTDSPFLYVKPNSQNHQKTKSYNGNDRFTDYVTALDSQINDNKILPPVLLKQADKKKTQTVIKPLYAGHNDEKEETKNEENSKLKDEMYTLLYGKSYTSEKK